MNLTESRRVIEALADGVDPRTGEVVAADSILESGGVVRALHTALLAIDAQIAREARQTRRLEGTGQSSSIRESARTELPAKAGEPWPAEEDDRLLREFEAGKPYREIAVEHERTTGAIVSRLERLGLKPR